MGFWFCIYLDSLSHFQREKGRKGEGLKQERGLIGNEGREGEREKERERERERESHVDMLYRPAANYRETTIH